MKLLAGENFAEKGKLNFSKHSRHASALRIPTFLLQYSLALRSHLNPEFCSSGAKQPVLHQVGFQKLDEQARKLCK